MLSRIEAPRQANVSSPRTSPQETTLALQVFFPPRMNKLPARQEGNIDSFLALVLRNGSITAVTIVGHADESGLDPARPWAHPYFWAPFTLSGDWL